MVHLLDLKAPTLDPGNLAPAQHLALTLALLKQLPVVTHIQHHRANLTH